MKKSYLIGLTVAVLFFVAANVKADVVHILGPLLSEDEYKSLVGNNQWKFEEVGKDNHGNPLEIGFKGGSLVLSAFDGQGSGAGGDKPVAEATEGGLALRFDHNSANKAVITFDNPVNDLFYFRLDDHTFVVETFKITVKGVSGDEYVCEEIPSSWVGFSIYDDLIMSITIEAYATWGGEKDNGFHVEFGTGQSSAVPEPATLVIVSLGLAGAGLARRKMKK